MKKFRGLFVPGPDLNRGEILFAASTKQKFCFKCKVSDCKAIGDNNCDKCLFFNITKDDGIFPEYDLNAFDIWYAAKGKVQYDAS